MTKPTIGIIVGSTRENRSGEKVARWIDRLAQATSLFQTQWVDLKDWPLPNYPHTSPPKMVEKTYSDEHQKGWFELISKLDGFIIVTPEYNHGYPAALKNALDFIYTPWNKKPVAFVSYGGTSGGVRSVQQLRQVVVELQMAPLRDEVNIPMVFRAFNEAGDPNDDIHAKRANVMFSELAWWAKVLKAGREG